MPDGGQRKRSLATATARPPMTRYYRGSTKQASPFEKKAPTKKFSSVLIKSIDVLLVLVIAFCIIYSLIVRPEPKIIASSNIYQPSYIYEAAATKDLTSLSDRTKLTFDEATLVDKLQQQFPEIAYTNVELPVFGQKPIIRMTISAPAFLLDSQGKRYVVSGDGVVVSMESKLPAARNLPIVTDKSGFGAQLGKNVLSSAQVNFISEVVEQTKRAGVPIASLTLPTAAQEMDLRTKDKTYLVKFYLNGDPLVEVGQFLAARNQFERNHQDPAKYLDVRIAGKIFFK